MFSKKPPASASTHGFSAGLEGGTTLVANNTRIKGDVLFEEQLYVTGFIEGNVTASDSKNDAPDGAKLVICEGGTVKGEVRAPHVVIDGTVEGDVYATNKVELAPKAKVVGNLHYNLVEMQAGSVVNGKMVSLEDAGPGALPAAVLSPEEQAKKKMREAVGDVVTGIR